MKGECLRRYGRWCQRRQSGQEGKGVILFVIQFHLWGGNEYNAWCASKKQSLGKILYLQNCSNFLTKFTLFTEKDSGHMCSKFSYNIWLDIKLQLPVFELKSTWKKWTSTFKLLYLLNHINIANLLQWNLPYFAWILIYKVSGPLFPLQINLPLTSMEG